MPGADKTVAGTANGVASAGKQTPKPQPLGQKAGYRGILHKTGADNYKLGA